MIIEINGRLTSRIQNKIGWMDNDPEEISEVAFCVTDFSKHIHGSRGHEQEAHLLSCVFQHFYNKELPGVLKYGFSSCASNIGALTSF